MTRDSIYSCGLRFAIGSARSTWRARGNWVDLRLKGVREGTWYPRRLRVLAILAGPRGRSAAGAASMQIGAVALPFEGGVLALDLDEVTPSLGHRSWSLEGGARRRRRRARFGGLSRVSAPVSASITGTLVRRSSSLVRRSTSLVRLSRSVSTRKRRAFDPWLAPYRRSSRNEWQSSALAGGAVVPKWRPWRVAFERRRERAGLAVAEAVAARVAEGPGTFGALRRRPFVSAALPVLRRGPVAPFALWRASALRERRLVPSGPLNRLRVLIAGHQSQDQSAERGRSRHFSIGVAFVQSVFRAARGRFP